MMQNTSSQRQFGSVGFHSPSVIVRCLVGADSSLAPNPSFSSYMGVGERYLACDCVIFSQVAESVGGLADSAQFTFVGEPTTEQADAPVCALSAHERLFANNAYVNVNVPE
jgi:hypothetical protein